MNFYINNVRLIMMGELFVHYSKSTSYNSLIYIEIQK